MSSTLVIVESPAKAKSIGKFLGKRYTVKASMGHVRDLPKSQLGVDLDADFAPKYITIRGKGEILKQLRDAAKRSTSVLLATDPDREGEAIAWHLAQALGLDPNDKLRIEFRQITKGAIQDAVKHPKGISSNLIDAQQGRRVLDRIVGYKLSPLLWKKVKRGLSAGRVQSVAVRMICDRETEINEFVQEEYWSAVAHLLNKEGQAFEAKLQRFQGKKIKLETEADAKTVQQGVTDAKWQIVGVKERTRKRNPAPPFITSTLQQEASRKLNFGAKKTMRIAQQLYEGIDIGREGTVGLITYMRTDSTAMAPEAVSEAREEIENRFGKEFLPKSPNTFRAKKSAQEAHEAIRPTSLGRDPKQLKEHLRRDQQRLYKLIWERAIASQMSPAKINQVSADLVAGDYTFRATGSSIAFLGFIKVYTEGTDDPEETSGMLPDLVEGDSASLQELKLQQHFTQPPPRYNEAMLVKTLEEKGIGRPSTYAAIIDTLVQRGYVILQEKRFHPTELGIIVVQLLKEHFANLIDVDFTAKLESQLDEVEAGNASWLQVVGDFYDAFKDDLSRAEEEAKSIEIADEETDVPCEKCGRNMVIKMGRFGKFMACPGYPDCKNTKPILNEIGVPCPTCQDGQIVQRRSKRGRPFYGCSNYPKCEFTSWQRPVDQQCPKCGSIMVIPKKDSPPVCSAEGCKQ